MNNKRRNISITDNHYQTAQDIGLGNASNGIRRALEVYEEFLILVDHARRGKANSAGVLAKKLTDKYKLR